MSTARSASPRARRIGTRRPTRPPSRIRCRSPTPSIGATVELDDDITGPNAGARGGLPSSSWTTSRPRGRPSEAATTRRQRARATHDAEVGAADPTMLDQRRDDPARRAIDRHGEAQADARHRGVDADDAAARVRERAPGVARIERGIGLDHVLDEPARATIARGDRPPERRDDTRRHGPREAQRIADRDHELADLEPRGVPERRGRGLAALRADDREIRERIAADDARTAISRAVDEHRRRRDRPRDHVGRRDEAPHRASRDRRPGAAPRQPPGACTRRDGDRRDQPFRDRADRARISVEELGVILGRRRPAGRGHRPPGRAPGTIDYASPVAVVRRRRTRSAPRCRGRSSPRTAGWPARAASSSASTSVIGLPATSTIRSPSTMPAFAARLSSSTPRTSRPVTLRQADRPAHPARDVRRRHGDAESRPARRLAAAEGVDPLAQGGVGRQRQVEAFADPVGVQADQPAGRVEERAAGRAGASGAVCSTLPAMRRPPGPRNARSTDETKPNVTRVPPVGWRRHRRPPLRRPGRSPAPNATAVAPAGVHLDHGEVAVPVDAGHAADGASGRRRM